MEKVAKVRGPTAGLGRWSILFAICRQGIAMEDIEPTSTFHRTMITQPAGVRRL